MVKKSRNLGLIVGSVFTLISFLATFTLAVPIATVMPTLFIEQKLSNIFLDLSYQNIGLMMIFILLLLFLLLLVLVFNGVKKKERLKIGNLILTMCVFYIIVHPLGYYLFWGICLHFKMDAQLAFNAVYSFPFSSLSFVLIGFLLDQYQRKQRIRY